MSFSLHEDRDRDLIDKLRDLAKSKEKSETIRAALERYFGIGRETDMQNKLDEILHLMRSGAVVGATITESRESPEVQAELDAVWEDA
jgi:hypothetical protein